MTYVVGGRVRLFLVPRWSLDLNNCQVLTVTAVKQPRGPAGVGPNALISPVIRSK